MLILSAIQLLSFVGLLQFTVGCDHVDDVRRAESMMLAQLKISTLNAEIVAVRTNLTAMGIQLETLSASAPPLRIRGIYRHSAQCDLACAWGHRLSLYQAWR